MTTAQGMISFLQAAPDAKTQGATVPKGRWCLHTTSTVPFVAVLSGSTARTITWGEAIDVDTQGAVVNVSAHAGDIHLSPVVSEIVSPRPAQYSIPVIWSQISGEEGPQLVTQWLDVRNARRAFLMVLIDPLPVPIFFEHSYDVNPKAPPIGLATGPQSNAAAAAGIVTEARAVALNQYSLGLRARDVAPGDPYPHCLLARVRARFPSNLQTLITNDPFFHVEF